MHEGLPPIETSVQPSHRPNCLSPARSDARMIRLHLPYRAMFRRHIRLRSGESLARTVADYDAARPMLGRRRLRTVCYAPFLSMDFDATGAIRLCNHSHTAIGNVGDGASVLAIWRGAAYEQYRADFSRYILDERNCPHCVRQCQAGKGQHVFATEQFDKWANDERHPAYPKRLIFRLNNTCNLACIMCDGTTSSRIRKERDGLPQVPSAYGEDFFREMEAILPHVEHIEFYGGEPFLVREHQRIFEILQRIGARCSIFINTNAMAINARARAALEGLNVVEVAVSMDAVSQDVHGEVRHGIDNDIFFRNVDYLLDLRKRNGLTVMLNVTEHRKNWFELPEIFRFAEKHALYLHINTCIHPHNVTLYTLPDDQLRYVHAFLTEERARIQAEFPRWLNVANFDFLVSLIRSELDGRTADWSPRLENVNRHCDGLLAAPIPGVHPFDDASRVLLEADRMTRFLSPECAARMLGDMLARIDTGDEEHAWASVRNALLARLALNPAAARRAHRPIAE